MNSLRKIPKSELKIRCCKAKKIILEMFTRTPDFMSIEIQKLY